ncbi:hypothetical protein DPMN_027128 [Dreissena polymorpha]|uniref:Uncharacterized protein n=1 Tax=Dreissena polymorpha TaxID=45954 RepID=A0A9D4LUM7_DREPO|nr:hypothetical protein DPMN_027128 [Dreissena polymorpha]
MSHHLCSCPFALFVLLSVTLSTDRDVTDIFVVAGKDICRLFTCQQLSILFKSY